MMMKNSSSFLAIKRSRPWPFDWSSDGCRLAETRSLANLFYTWSRPRLHLVLTQSHLDAVLEWPEGVRRFALDTLDLAAVSDAPLARPGRPRLRHLHLH